MGMCESKLSRWGLLRA